MLNTRFVVTLILSSLVTGVGIGIVTAIQRDLAQGVKVGAVAFLLVGVLMAVIIIPIQLFSTRKLTSQECQPRQSRELIVAGNLSSVLDLLFKVLSELTFIRNIEKNLERKSILAKTRMSWASYGEVITIEASAVEEGKVLVKISSSPAVKFTVADYGKNARNLQAVFTKLAALGAGGVQPKHGNVA
ncbi:MAG: hypothetical protein ABIP05_09275 [Nitrospiraceae bacterium]